ncbi:hypothetical protein [Roseivirga sp.]|uniref:hypothetical protein n=1 Tax=Roseivirga sp. TaxID=1964215 RepID=UPI003B529980
MKAVITLLFGLLLFFPQDTDLNEAAGNWQGSIDVQGKSMRIVFHVVNSEGKLSATMDSPDQNAFGYKMDEAKYSDKTLELTINQAGGHYKGTLKDEKFIGEWSQGGQKFPLVLTRIKRTGSSE